MNMKELTTEELLLIKGGQWILYQGELIWISDSVSIPEPERE